MKKEGKCHRLGRCKSNVISSAYAWAKPTQMSQKNVYASIWPMNKRKKNDIKFCVDQVDA